MIPPHKPGHLGRGGELLLTLIRKRECADCQVEIEGPPSMKRCKDCQRHNHLKVRRRYERAIRKGIRKGALRKVSGLER